jgi:putative tryptophan/tyrosine transport system substrate-binding protein
MRRREFIAGLAGAAAAAWSARALAQQAGARKIAVLMGSAPTKLGESYLAAFQKRLEERGWAHGRNVRIETRWWTGTPNAMQPVITELIASAPDVVMVFSNLALAVLKPMAGQIPIVFVGVGDPVGDGFVASLARPGGSITGFAGTDGPIGGKWLEVLKETVPSLSRAMLLMHAETPIHREFWRSAEAAAPRFGVEVVQGAVHDAAGIERALASFSSSEGRGLIVAPHAVTWANEQLIIALTLQHRLPAHFATAASVMAGGLVCYGHDFEDSFRKTAEYVDRVLRGEKPADLPVQMPTKFRLVLNLKTAKHLGLAVPAALLARADEVIE